MSKRNSDSDDSDSDYDPTDEPVKDDDDDANEGKDSKLSEISTSRKRKVDMLWESMNSEETESNVMRLTSKPRKTTAKRDRKSENILASIFGKSDAKKIIKGQKSKSTALVSSVGKEECDSSTKEAIRESLKKVQKKQKVVETRKFAGQEITIERTVLGDAYKKKDSEDGKHKSTSALDSVLDTLKGPKVVSTVSKSAMDWDNFKEKEGLEDELAVASKDGYLTRKEFLDRCDVRAFEKERDVRLKAAVSSQIPM